MSAHRTGYDAYKLLEQGGLADPGSAGTIDLDAQSGMVCVCTPAAAEDRTLSISVPAGTRVDVVNNGTDAITLKDSASSPATIATIATKEVAMCVAGSLAGVITWTATIGKVGAT